MEIVNVERIFTIALVIFLGAYILSLIIIRKTRKSAFSKLAKCDDSKVYFETLIKYLHTAKTQSDRDMLRLLKLNGMIKFKEWDGIVEVIKSINEPISISRQHIHVVCRIVLNLFNLDKIEEAKMLISKISNLDKILMGNDRVMLCKAIDEYFDNNLNSSKNTLEQLLNSYTKDQDYILIIHYYLGMIYLKTGDTKNISPNVTLPNKIVVRRQTNKMPNMVLFGVTKSNKESTIRIEGKPPLYKEFTTDGDTFTLWYTTEVDKSVLSNGNINITSD